MSHLIWLASYPKSGNTWMRALLTAYLGGPDAELDINDLDASRHAASRPLFDRVTGLPSSSLLPDEVDVLRPQVYRAVNSECVEPMFLKVHDAWRTVGQDALFPADCTRLAVLIVRNPLAVAPSLAEHSGRTIDGVIEVMADPDHALAGSGSAAQLRQVMGSWSDHTGSWLERSGLPVHLVRYEDLRRDTASAFRGVVQACGLGVDEAAITAAVERTSFDRLREQEAETGFRERLGSSPFFRRGMVDGWREELTDEQAARIRADHAEWMARLGYSSDDDSGEREQA